MKKFLRVFSACLAAVTLLSGMTQAGINNKGANWKLSFKRSVSEKCYLAGFLNDKFGITVGYGGETHYTNDSGKTWLNSKNVSMCRWGLFILNQNMAWSSGNGSQVRKTIDGGKNWTEVADFGGSEPFECKNMSFINANFGWISSSIELGTTNNGGKTWSSVQLPKNVGAISSACRINKDGGYLLNTAGKLFFTNNQGKTWNSKNIGLLKNESILDLNGPSSVINFKNEKNGVIVYQNRDRQIKYLSTKDGGKTWTRSIVPSDSNVNYIYLSPDAKMLTLTVLKDSNVEIQVLKYTGK